MIAEVLAKYRFENGAYRKVSGGAKYPDTMPLTMRMTDMQAAKGERELTEKERQEVAPAAPDVRAAQNWDTLGNVEVARIARDNPKRFEALKAEREFRREQGLVGLDAADAVGALNKRKRPDLVARFLELRETIRA